MLERIQNINTINIRQPKEYQKFEYDVEIDGQKQNASIEKFPNGKVKINLGDGKNNKTIITDEKGLIEFNKKHQKQDKIFNSQEEKKQSDTEEKLSWHSKIMRNLALAQMMLVNRHRNGFNNTLNNGQNDMMQQQIIQQMNQQAFQDHMTAVQMTTPGMGII